MIFRHFLAFAALLSASPAFAATIILHPAGVDRQADFRLDEYLSDGLYLARFNFSGRTEPGSLLTFITQLSYDFYGVEDGVHYGGNDHPIYWDHYFAGTRYSTLVRIERPYRLLDYWGGDVGYIEERGYHYLEAMMGEFYFRSNEPVRMDYSVERISAVPEPSNWAMMIAGFAVAGWMRRRKKGERRHVAFPLIA